jgi:hypothetical protein
MLQESGVRFLQRAGNDEEGWVEIDDEAARKKVGHAFRNLRKGIIRHSFPTPEPNISAV